jgi:SecD/SecF fusion protein
MTIRNGFSRAMSTIVDSNMTTIMSGVVLFLVGTDQIKGFAVTLILGLMVSLYTAVFVARLIFDIVERKRWVTHLRMMQLIGETHIDFVRLRGPAIAASLVVIGIGLGAVIARGGGLFDIDFTGGSSVQIKFDEDKPQDIQHIRESLGDLPDLAVSGVGAHNSAFKQWEFKIDTSEQDIAKVEQKIEDVFGTDLATYGMKFGSLEPYTPPVPPSASAQSTSTGSPAGSATSPAVRDVSIPAAPAATPPAASTKTPVADPATTPPAAATPAATTPPTSPPPATPSGTPEKQEAPAGDAAPAKPDAGKQGAWRRGIQELRITLQEHLFSKVREARSVASLVGSTWMALQASSDGATPKADSTAAPAAAPAEGAPAAPKPEEAKPADSSPAAPSGAAPAATPSPASAPSDSAMPAETAKPTETAKQTESAEPPKAGLKTTLTFAEPISYNALHPMILNWLVEHKLDSEQFDISNPKHQTGSSSPFREWTLTTQLPADAAEKLLGDLQTKLVATPVFPSANNIGGKVAGKAQFLAMWALVASLVMIVIYVWIRFQNVMFGVAAVLALVHDVLVTIGFLALSKYLAPVLGFAMVDDFKISLAVVAALLTIIGYSINDTIVIFDRIREIRGKNPDLTETMINLSVNQTLGRTLLTSGTVLIGAMILYFGGGEGIHPFAYAMLIGLISGTYSTVYIASPVLLWLRKADEKKNRPEVASRVGAARKAAG